MGIGIISIRMGDNPWEHFIKMNGHLMDIGWMKAEYGSCIEA